MLRAPPVLLILFTVCGLLVSTPSRAQDPDAGPVVQSRGFRLEQNTPNPANPGTTIPFILEESLFREGEPRMVVVSMRIVNMFRQLVAVPKAYGYPRGNLPITSLPYTEPGRKLATWDGRDQNGRRVPSGLYYCELTVGDQVAVARIVVVSPRRRNRFFPFLRRGD